MNNSEGLVTCVRALEMLDDAFSHVAKPSPLASYAGSYCDEEVDVFNRTDWDRATYDHVADAMEGFIICPASSRVWLLPRLFRMVLERRTSRHPGAVDNLAMALENWPVDSEVEAILSEDQKRAVVAAWACLHNGLFAPSGSRVALELARRWAL